MRPNNVPSNVSGHVLNHDPSHVPSHDSGQKPSDGSEAHAQRLARLCRGSGLGELSEHTKMLLNCLLTEELGADDRPPAASPDRGEVLAEVAGEGSDWSDPLPELAEAETSEGERTPPPESVAADDDFSTDEVFGMDQDQDSDEQIPVEDLSSEQDLQEVIAEVPVTVPQLELKLRHLVDGNAPWDAMESVALKLFARNPDPETAARVMELAFVHASTEKLEALLLWAKKVAREFYRHLHPTLRRHLVMRLWRAGGSEALATLLFRVRDEDFLQPVERLFLLESMAAAADGTLPFLYFHRHQTEMMEAVAAFGAAVGLTMAAFRLRLGQLALELNFKEEGVQLLEGIDAGTSERDEALRLLLIETAEKNRAGRSDLSELLLAEASGHGRLDLMQRFLADTRALGGFRDRNRPALNEQLADPLSWLPAAADLWSELSHLLIANRDLSGLLPNLLAVFKTNAAKFHMPSLDLALWQAPSNLLPLAPGEDYWRGVGLLHFYVATGASAEASLWEAFAAVTQARDRWERPLWVTWSELQRAAFNWVAKAPHLSEAERARMLKQLRVAVPAVQITAADLAAYAEQSEATPLAVLSKLETLADGIKEPALACHFLLKRAHSTHLTNRDLNRIWPLALARSDHDLAWRTATVLHARQALAAAVRHGWEFSGEKRAQYGFYAPAKAHVDWCLAGMPAAAARLAHACVQVGGTLPELLALLDPGASVSRVSANPTDSLEAQADKALNQLDWLAQPKRRYRFSFESSLGGAQVPAFMQVLPANPWSLLVARIADRLGINAWGWRVSRLQSQVVELIPRLASRQDLRRSSGRVAVWLRDLTPEQRAAWHDLAALPRALDDQTAALALASFVCRLAILVYPNHYLALTSLAAMRAQVAIIWDVETWLLGEAYSKIRRSLGTATRVPVPYSLQRLPTILDGR